MHVNFILARHMQRLFVSFSHTGNHNYVSINGAYILVMMKHLAMQQEVSLKVGWLC